MRSTFAISSLIFFLSPVRGPHQSKALGGCLVFPMPKASPGYAINTHSKLVLKTSGKWVAGLQISEFLVFF